MTILSHNSVGNQPTRLYVGGYVDPNNGRVSWAFYGQDQADQWFGPYTGFSRDKVNTLVVASYKALIESLKHVANNPSLNGPGGIVVYNSCATVTKQIVGTFKTRQPHLIPLRDEVRDLIDQLNFRVVIQLCGLNINWGVVRLAQRTCDQSQAGTL
ncbi:MAG TPA: hypothetical protein VF131_24665 [Blastocatellia bacterium]|nr:hypothetical protein [Blastocatellia bacterium]